jgi:hypothetical protein
MPPGTRYLGEDETYWYFSHPGANPQLGDIFGGIGNMFSRMVKFTPQSFTPANIFNGFINTSLTALTGGVYQFLPKDVQKKMENVGKIAIPVVAGAVVAYTAGPAVMGLIGPKIQAAASMLGKAASTIGGKLFDALGKLPQAQQAQVAQQVTPQQIASMEQTGQIPYDLQSVLNAAAGQALPSPMLPSSGAASLYDASAQGPPSEPTQAGMLGGLDTKTILLFAVPAAFYMLSTATGKKR